MIKELDTAVLTHDIVDHGLKRGDVCTVVHCYAGDTAFEVEFVTADGKIIALLTLASTDIRAMSGGEILHVREFASA